jgi:hypothetical protein
LLCALLVFVLLLGTFAVSWLYIRWYVTAQEHGIGAIAGGWSQAVVVTVEVLVLCGVVCGVVSLVRREHQWVFAAAGIVLNLIAPLLAWGIIILLMA